MSIWDEQENDNKALQVLEPGDMVVQDMNFTNQLAADTLELINIVGFSAELSRAAQEVANYIPDTQDENSKFWVEKVVPALKQALLNDVTASNVMVHAMASVRDLAITIQKSGEIVKATKGSKTAVDLARKEIPAALATLKKIVEDVNTLENRALVVFAQHIDEFFKIIGPKAANFVRQKSEIDAQIIELSKEKQKVIDNLAHLTGELEKYSNLMHVTQTRVDGAAIALEETKGRTAQMRKLNDEVDNAIKTIPDTIPKTETVNTKHGFFWFHHVTTSTSTYQARNPDRESQKNYYESIIASRTARIKESDKEFQDKDGLKKKLDQDFAEYKNLYKQTEEKYREACSSFHSDIAVIQKQIDKLYEKRAGMDERSVRVEKEIGLTGNTLIDCLVAVRAFTASHQQSAHMYSPLSAALQSIVTFVKQDVGLLAGDDVHKYLAGNRFMSHVGMLVAYSLDTRQKLTQARKNFSSNSSLPSVSTLQISNN